MTEIGDVMVNVILLATSSSMTGLAVGQQWSGEAYPIPQTASGTLTAVR